MRDRRERRHGEGRNLLPDDGEEAPARAGDRAAESPAVHLPGGLRRREPAEPGRRVSRPRSFRPHLLQPGQHVGAGHAAGRRGDGFVHGRRRLRAGDERRVDHREEPGHDLPRGTAAGEGRHGRDRDRRGTGRRGRAHARVGRGGPLRAGRHARARDRATHRRQPERREAGGCGNRRAPATLSMHPRNCTASSRPMPASPTTCARSSPAWWTGANWTSSRRTTGRPWSAGSRASSVTLWESWPTTASCSRSRR